MEPFTNLVSAAVPLDEANVDTDRIIPARFLRRRRSEGYADVVFYDMRFDAQGEPRPGCTLVDPAYAEARILVAKENFGCGSSRESAVWALLDGGFRCVIAPSFGDIFYNNCSKNGLLPVRLEPAVVDELMALATRMPTACLAVDLEEQVVRRVDGGPAHRFEIDPFRKRCLLEGLDDIGLTFEHDEAFARFVEARRAVVPWIFGDQR